jgi:flagellar protein FliO/FliZ
MEIISLQQLFQLVLALALVVALMGGLAYLLKKLGLGTVSPTVARSKKRLKIVESQALDARRRLVILQCDDKQHLVILGQNGETVIQRDIEAPDLTALEQQESAGHAS